MTVPNVTEEKKNVAAKISSHSKRMESLQGKGKGKGKGKTNPVIKSSPAFSRHSKLDNTQSNVVSSSSSQKLSTKSCSSSFEMSSSSPAIASTLSYPTLSPSFSPSFPPSLSTSFSPSISPTKDTRSAVTRRDTKKHSQLSVSNKTEINSNPTPPHTQRIPYQKKIYKKKTISIPIPIVTKHTVGRLKKSPETVLCEPMEVEIYDNIKDDNQLKTKSQHSKITKITAKKTSIEKVAVKKVTAENKIKPQPSKKTTVKLMGKTVKKLNPFIQSTSAIQTTLESHRIEAGKYLYLTESELKYLKVSSCFCLFVCFSFSLIYRIYSIITILFSINDIKYHDHEIDLISIYIEPIHLGNCNFQKHVI